MRDITEIIEREYNRSLQKLSEIMIASTSHDMRTPLNTIVAMLNLLQIKIEDDEEALKWLRIANNSTNLLLFLVNDTLDYF